MSTWTLDADNGDLHILSGVTGRAAKMGHRLTMGLTSWQARVDWDGDTPTRAALTIDVDSLEVLRGEGGVIPLGGTEKGVARSNALKALDVKKYPQIHFTADDIAKTADGYRMTGTVEIHGTSRPQVVDVKIEDNDGTLTLSTQVRVPQTDYGVRLISLFMGAMKVADEVVIDFRATHPK